MNKSRERTPASTGKLLKNSSTPPWNLEYQFIELLMLASNKNHFKICLSEFQGLFLTLFFNIFRDNQKFLLFTKFGGNSIYFLSLREG